MCVRGLIKINYSFLLCIKDSVIYGRLKPGDPLAEMTDTHLKVFASSGLRTLCISEATLEKEFYEVCVCICCRVMCICVHV